MITRVPVVNTRVPVVDVILSAVLLVDRPLVVVIDHPVDAEHVGVVLFHRPVRLQHHRRAPWWQKLEITLSSRTSPSAAVKRGMIF